MKPVTHITTLLMSAIQAQIAADAVQQEYDRIAEIEDEQRRAYELGEFEDFSVFRDLLPFLPANMKQYMYDLMGGDKPLTVNDLTDQELELLQKLLLPLIPEDAKPGDVIDVPYEAWQSIEPERTYSDVTRPRRRDEYLDPKTGERRPLSELPEDLQRRSLEAKEKTHPGFDNPTEKNLFQNMRNPNFRLKTLMGDADIEIRIDEQGLPVPVLVDQFNYNEDPTAREIEDQAMADVTEGSLYPMLRTIGGVFGSDPGEGSPIEIEIPPELAEGGPTERVVEIEEEEGYDPELTLMGKIILDMFPSTEKSMGENIFDIATLAVPPLKVLKAAKVADPLLDTGIMQMAGKTYGGGFSKPGFTKIRGGGKDITLKTRNPKVWNVYTDIARFSDGGSNPGKLTPQQVEQLRKIMPQLRGYASSQKRHGRSTMNNVVRMFDENFK